MPETKNVSGEYKLRVNGTTCLHVTPDGINGALGATTPAAITGTTGAFTTVTTTSNLLVGTSVTASGFLARVNGNLVVGTGAADVSPDGTGAGQIKILGNGYSASLAADASGVTLYTNSASRAVVFATDETARARVSGQGNVLIAGTSDPASAVGALAIFNGTAPTGSVTNGVVLYSEDVTASAELKVRDEAGNITTLSPHNFSLIPDGPSEPLAWAYYSERDGRKINVDMLALARQVERLSGERLVYEEAA